MAWRAHSKTWKPQPQGHLADHEKHRGFGDDGTGVLRCGPRNSQRGEASFGHELMLRRDPRSRPAVLIDGWPTGEGGLGPSLTPWKGRGHRQDSGTGPRAGIWLPVWTYLGHWRQDRKQKCVVCVCVCPPWTLRPCFHGPYKGRLFSTWGGPILRKGPPNTQWTWEKMSIF